MYNTGSAGSENQFLIYGVPWISQTTQSFSLFTSWSEIEAFIAL